MSSRCKRICVESGRDFQLNVVCPAPKCRSRFRTVPKVQVLCCCVPCLCWVALSSNLIPWLHFEVESVLRVLPCMSEWAQVLVLLSSLAVVVLLHYFLNMLVFLSVCLLLWVAEVRVLVSTKSKSFTCVAREKINKSFACSKSDDQAFRDSRLNVLGREGSFDFDWLAFVRSPLCFVVVWTFFPLLTFIFTFHCFHLRPCGLRLHPSLLLPPSSDSPFPFLYRRQQILVSENNNARILDLLSIFHNGEIHPESFQEL